MILLACDGGGGRIREPQQPDKNSIRKMHEAGERASISILVRLGRLSRAGPGVPLLVLLWASATSETCLEEERGKLTISQASMSSVTPGGIGGF